MEAWRLVRAEHAASAFSGEGAAKFGGRWNSRGVPVVYASAAASLAALETLVHLQPPVAFVFRIFRLEFPARLVSRLDASSLPPDWQAEPPPLSTRLLGDAWARSLRSAILAVPSVILPQETNFVLNPAHPDFPSLTLHPPVDFAFNPRLLA